MNTHRRVVLICVVVFLSLITLACNAPAEILEQIRIFFALPVVLDDGESEQYDLYDNGEQDLESNQTKSDSNISQCNAVAEISLSITDFSEDIYNAGSECDFNIQVMNNSTLPVQVYYFLYPNQSDELPPAWGWLRGGEIQPGNTWKTTVQDAFRLYAGSSLYAKGTSSMAFVYSTPECAWITLGGIQADILEIKDETQLASLFPCTQFAFSDISPSAAQFEEGLTND